MMRPLKLLSLICLCSHALGLTPAIRDYAGIFEDRTLAAMLNRIEQIETRFGKQIFLETRIRSGQAMPTVRSEEDDSTLPRNSVWKDPRLIKPNGIYFLIYKQTTFLDVRVGAGERSELSLAETHELMRLLVRQFSLNRRHEGMLEALEKIESTLDRPWYQRLALAEESRDPQLFYLNWLVALLILVGTWVCLPKAVHKFGFLN